MWCDLSGGIVVLILLVVATNVMLDIDRINRGSNPCGSSNDHHHPACDGWRRENRAGWLSKIYARSHITSTHA